MRFQSVFSFAAIVSLAAILAAALLHWFTWWLRLNARKVPVVFGALGALGITTLGTIYLQSDIGDIARQALYIFWALALALGFFQARAIPAAWWEGTLALLFEATLGFLFLSTVNLSTQWLVLNWRLADRLPQLFAYPQDVIEHFILIFLLTFLALALIRPLVRYGKRPSILGLRHGGAR